MTLTTLLDIRELLISNKNVLMDAQWAAATVNKA
jgi:hypothetical protein